MIKHNYRLSTLSILSVFYSFFIYRSIFSGQLIGEPFDSRLQIILHEHWWRWFNGLNQFRDVVFFYPFDKDLGFSDVFLVQGPIYSIFRFFGLNLSTSWTLTTFTLLLVGNLGWAFIAFKYIKSFSLQILMTLTLISSSSFVYYFTLNPNILGYLYLSWIALLLGKINSERNLYRKHKLISFFITIMLIYSLSCWYASFFVILILVIRFFLEFLFLNKKVINNIHQFRKLIFYKPYLIQLPLQIFLIWLFKYIYFSVAFEPIRTIDELIKNSPIIGFLANGNGPSGNNFSGAFFKSIYLLLGLDIDKEFAIGVGLFNLLIGFLLIFYTGYKRLFSKNQVLWLLSIFIGYFYFVNWFGITSFHRYFYDLIPGFNSIRYPGRYIIILGFVMIFLIYQLLDKYINKYNDSKKIPIILVASLLLLDQYRAPFKGWQPETLINSELMAQKEEIIKNCDYFYYNFPGGWWYEQIEAMAFSSQIGIPTINGYSGAFPIGYPKQDFNSIDRSTKIIDWISKVDKNKRGCFVTGRSEIKPLYSDFEFIDFVGFTNQESNGKVFWRWAVNSKPYIYIFSSKLEKRKVEFSLNFSTCNQDQNITMIEDNFKLIKNLALSKQQNIILDLDMKDKIVKRIQFNTNALACKIDGDPRNLYFEIKNFSIN